MDESISEAGVGVWLANTPAYYLPAGLGPLTANRSGRKLTARAIAICYYFDEAMLGISENVLLAAHARQINLYRHYRISYRTAG